MGNGRIRAGGLQVEGGGATVAGGLELTSGELTLSDPESRFAVTGKGFSSTTAHAASAAVEAEATDPNYSGTLLSLAAARAPAGASQYSFLEAKAGGSTVFSVSDGGAVEFVEGRARGELEVDGGLVANGGVVLAQTKSGGAGVEIDAGSVSFFEIEAGAAGPLTVVGSPAAGQLLLVKNSAAVGFSLGPARVPAGTLLLFVYAEPGGWQDVTAAAAHTKDPKGVTELVAEQDLDIGDFDFAAKRLVSTTHEEVSKGLSRWSSARPNYSN